MKQYFMICVLIAFASITSAQVKFEQGYIMNDKNEKIECLIKNIGWKNSPQKIEYKLSDENKSNEIDVAGINEFVIYGASKYKKFTVNIDRDSYTDERNQIHKNKDPQFNEETILLKCLIEGKANLFVFEEGTHKKYFYNVDNSQVFQLVYKRYLINIDTMEDKGTHQKGDHPLKILENNKYKQQLWMDLQCDGIVLKDIELISYNQNNIIKYFAKYNECQNSPFLVIKKKIKKRDLFNLYIQAGSSYSSLLIENTAMRTLALDIDFDYSFGYRFGFDFEFIAPFNNNKWALSFNPSYFSYKTEKYVKYIQYSSISYYTNILVDFKTIEIPLGLKYNFFLNDNSKINLNISFIVDYSVNSIIDFEADELTDFEPHSIVVDWNYGMGYKFKNKYSIDFKYQSNKSLFGNFLFWNGNLKVFSITFGYNLLNLKN